MTSVSDDIAAIDPELAIHGAAVDELCPHATVGAILRHVPSRRITARVDTPSGPATLKVFARPRARGNERRLRALAATPAATVVPRSRATDPTGHVNLLEFVPGEPLVDVAAAELPTAAAHAGRALRVLHDCGAQLDRTWTVDNELTQLWRTTGPRSAAIVEQLIASTPPPAEELLVPAHRDCHPAQAVYEGNGRLRWIDLDDAAMAPAGLDVGNFLAHVTREEVLGRWSAALANDVRAAFLGSYAATRDDVTRWEQLALARLVALADTRHGSTDEMRKLLQILPLGTTTVGLRGSDVSARQLFDTQA